jgi:ribonuclease BN (tRNA processing enzyme)
LQVTVLGKSPSWQDAAGACSGYLVQAGELQLLLDCGNGVFSKLRSAVDYRSIGEVLISHLHADHFLDLVPFSYALANAVRGDKTRNGSGDVHVRPSLRVPVGGHEVLRRIVGNWGSADLIDDAFEITEYRPDDVLTLGPLQVRFREVPHFIRSNAVELASGGRRFVFGADCAPNQADGRGDVVDARAGSRPRSHDPERGRRARGRGPRAAARADPLLRRDGPVLGCGPGRRQLRRPSRAGARGRRL